MVYRINGSVGQGGTNSRADVTLVQQLLNLMPENVGGPAMPIAVDGFIGPQTVGTISRFQKANFGWSDGRVDPNGKTLVRLSDVAEALNSPGVAGTLLATKSSGPKPPMAGGMPSTIDNAGGAGIAMADTHAGVVSVSGSVFANWLGTVSPAFPGTILRMGDYLWTLKNSSATVDYWPSKRMVYVPPSSMFFVGSKGPVPTASVQYYQVGKSKPGSLNVKTGQITAPYQKSNNGVSPGYFNQ